MIRALIVDDEKSGRETLAFVLERFYASRVHVLAMAASVNEALEMVARLSPELVFLDMEMPAEPGLNLLKRLETVDFETIVTTAHREYGLDALKAGVFDYLLKPVEIEELGLALTKLEKKLETRREEATLKKMLGQLTHPGSEAHKIPLLVSSNKTLFVEPENIIRCEADGNYTRVFFTSGKSELVTRLIRDMEELLAGHSFFRVHKSHLINLKHVKALQKPDDDLVLSDDSLVPLSRNVKSEFLAKMKLG